MANSEAMISVTKRQFFIGLALILVLVALGAGGYLVGLSTGEDLEQARAEGTAQGQREGAAQGAEEGFAEGRKQGRDAAYAESYSRGYRIAYTGAFEDAGLDPPEQIDVPEPSQ